jgi:hypothetical protein
MKLAKWSASPATASRQSGSVAAPHSAHTSIIALDRDGPTATEPSSFVCITAVAPVVPLTVCRSPSIDPDAARSYVHTLTQTWGWRCNVFAFARPPRRGDAPRAGSPSQRTTVIPIAIAAAAMTAVAIQPINRSPSWTGNFPMTFGFAVMCIIVIMTGTATTPLITALQ